LRIARITIAINIIHPAAAPLSPAGQYGDLDHPCSFRDLSPLNHELNYQYADIATVYLNCSRCASTQRCKSTRTPVKNSPPLYRKKRLGLSVQREPGALEFVVADTNDKYSSISSGGFVLPTLDIFRVGSVVCMYICTYLSYRFIVSYINLIDFH